MSTESDSQPESVSDPENELQPVTGQPVPDRYAALETGDGDVVIYDRETPSAWLQSDAVVDPDR